MGGQSRIMQPAGYSHYHQNQPHMPATQPMYIKGPGPVMTQPHPMEPEKLSKKQLFSHDGRDWTTGICGCFEHCASCTLRYVLRPLSLSLSVCVCLVCLLLNVVCVQLWCRSLSVCIQLLQMCFTTRNATHNNDRRRLSVVQLRHNRPQRSSVCPSARPRTDLYRRLESSLG